MAAEPVPTTPQQAAPDLSPPIDVIGRAIAETVYAVRPAFENADSRMSRRENNARIIGTVLAEHTSAFIAEHTDLRPRPMRVVGGLDFGINEFYKAGGQGIDDPKNRVGRERALQILGEKAKIATAVYNHDITKGVYYPEILLATALHRRWERTASDHVRGLNDGLALLMASYGIRIAAVRSRKIRPPQKPHAFDRYADRLYDDDPEL